MIPSSTCPSWQHDIPAHPDILVALISYTTGGDTISTTLSPSAFQVFATPETLPTPSRVVVEGPSSLMSRVLDFVIGSFHCSTCSQRGGRLTSFATKAAQIVWHVLCRGHIRDPSEL